LFCFAGGWNNEEGAHLLFLKQPTVFTFFLQLKSSSQFAQELSEARRTVDEQESYIGGKYHSAFSIAFNFTFLLYMLMSNLGRVVFFFFFFLIVMFFLKFILFYNNTTFSLFS